MYKKQIKGGENKRVIEESENRRKTDQTNQEQGV